MQILVTKELDKELHIWVTSLTRSLSTDQAQKLLGSCSNLNDETDMKNADSVVNVASQANIELFKRMIQEGDQMCEELKELLAPEIVEFKIRLAEQNAQLADKDAKLADNAAKLADKDAKLANKEAEITKLKKRLKEVGIEVQLSVKEGNQTNIATAKQLDHYTMEDIYNLPDGQRAELIDGELYMMAVSEHDTFEQYSFLNKVKVGIYEDFEIDFAGIIIEQQYIMDR